MNRARERHRDLDRAALEAEAGDGRTADVPPGLYRPRRFRKDDMTMDRTRQPRVLLLELRERTSARGTRYMTGWAGKARLVGFQGGPDEDGCVTWKVYAEEPSPKPGPGDIGR